MPVYQYKCTNCNTNFDFVQSMKDYKELKKCPECGKYTLQRIFSTGYGFVKLADSEIKTVGHLAHRNRENMSKEQRRDLYMKHNEYKYREPKKDLPKGMRRVKREIPEEYQ